MMRFKEGEQAMLLYCRTSPDKPPQAGDIVTVMYVGPYGQHELTPAGKLTPLGADYVVGTDPGSVVVNHIRCVLDAQLAKLTELPPDESAEVSEELEEDV